MNIYVARRVRPCPRARCVQAEIWAALEAEDFARFESEFGDRMGPARGEDSDSDGETYS